MNAVFIFNPFCFYLKNAFVLTFSRLWCNLFTKLDNWVVLIVIKFYMYEIT